MHAENAICNSVKMSHSGLYDDVNSQYVRLLGSTVIVMWHRSLDLYSIIEWLILLCGR